MALQYHSAETRGSDHDKANHGHQSPALGKDTVLFVRAHDATK